MTRQAQISTIISIVFHVLALFIFAGVKIYTDRNIEASVPVTFVDTQKTKPQRRSVDVRPMVSLSQSPQRHTPEQYTVRPEYKSSAEFYVEAPTKVFSTAKSAGQEMFRDAGVQRPAVEFRGSLSKPIAQNMPDDLRPDGPNMQPRISGGHELLSNIVPAQARPDIDVADDVLKSFAMSVRRRIESKKEYPIAAQTAELEGRTEVRMTILKDGRLEKVEIAESSGYEILDRAALQSVRNAAPFPPIPKATKRDKIEMGITLVFKAT